MSSKRIQASKALIIILFILAALGASAQVRRHTVRDSLRQAFVEERSNKYKDYNEKASALREQYVKLRDSLSNAYSEELRKAWIEIKGEEPVPMPKDEPLPVPPTPIDKTPIDNKPIDNKPINVKPDVTPIDVKPDVTPIDVKPNTPIDVTPIDVTPIDNKHPIDDYIFEDDLDDENLPPTVSPRKDRKVNIDKDIVKIPLAEPQPEPYVPIPPVPTTPREQKTDFVLYGTDMQVPSISAPLKGRRTSWNNNSIADAWKAMTTDDVDKVIDAALQLREKHQLCDWSYLRLLDKIADEIQGAGTDESTLLRAYMFSRSGYKMRLATTDNGRPVMFYGTNHVLFGIPTYKIDGNNFIPDKADISGTPMYFSQAKYPGEKPLSFYITREQLFDENPADERTISGRHASVTLSADLSAIEFCDNYPANQLGDIVETRWAMLAQTPISASTREVLYPELTKAIEGKSKADQMRIILNWMQFGFPYGYDDQIWGGDRAFFPDETLYYPKSDCEDHAILYSRLIRDLVGLPVILVHYPGHLAAATAIEDPSITGDYIQYDGKRYFITDPTYVGAAPGRTMTGMNNATAKVISLD